MNLQFFVNSNLFTIYFNLYTETSAIKIELHIRNKTTVEFDCHENNLDIIKGTIMYDDFILTLKDRKSDDEIIYDFKTAISQTHYYGLALAPYTIGQYLDFYYYVGDEPRSFGSILSPYD
jgi:hypothetical protein